MAGIGGEWCIFLIDRLVGARFGIVLRDRSSRDDRRSPPDSTGRHYISIAPLKKNPNTGTHTYLLYEHVKQRLPSIFN